MADYFMDTSALVKYYHPEDGTQAVTRFIEEPASHHYISRLSLVETVSAFAVKYRMGHINDKSLMSFVGASTMISVKAVFGLCP